MILCFLFNFLITSICSSIYCCPFTSLKSRIIHLIEEILAGPEQDSIEAVDGRGFHDLGVADARLVEDVGRH